MAGSTVAGWTVVELADQLRALGVGDGDVAMVHASLRRIGRIEGGADGLIAAFRHAIGPTGTIIVPLGARDDWAWVNERPEYERAELLADAEPFDASITPGDPEVGAFPEALRVHEGTTVSDHPEGRFAANGPLATELLRDVPWNDYYGPGSPLERFVRAGGRVVRLGADVDTMTVLHYAEYLVDLPSKRRVRRHRLVRRGDAVELRVVECLDDSEGIVDQPGGADYFTDLSAEYLASDRVGRGIVGAARAEIVESADLVDFAVAWMTEHLPGRTRQTGR